MVVLLCSLIILFVLIYYLNRIKHNYWNRKNVPHLPPTPLFGNYGPYIRQQATMHEVAHEICQKFPKEPMIGAYLATAPVLIVKDPELLKLVFTKDFYYFCSREVSDYCHREVLTRNLFFTYGDNWRVLRQNFTPIFTSAKMKAMFRLIMDLGPDLERLFTIEMKKGPEIDVRRLAARFTMDVICSCVFGVESHVMTAVDVNTNIFRQMADSILESSTSRAFKFAVRSAYPSLLYNTGFTVFPSKIHHFFGKVMLDVMENRKGNPSPRNDVIDVMLVLRKAQQISGDAIENYRTSDKEKVHLKVDDELLVAMCVVLFAGGFETSSSTMSFTLYELAKHPKFQEKAFKEVNEYLKKTGGVVDNTCLTELPYLEQCVDETLRLYPVLGVLTREVYRDYIFPNGLKVEKGLAIHIPLYHMHLREDYWHEPYIFRPDRFSPENRKKIQPYTYMPFGEGPRLCIGMRFAKMQVMFGLATILGKYRVDPTPQTPEKIAFNPKSFVSASAADIILKFTLRN